jgi:hypothetical protein
MPIELTKKQVMKALADLIFGVSLLVPAQKDDSDLILKRVIDEWDRFTKMKGIALIAAERERQITEKSWTPENDDTHNRGDLAKAAAACILNDQYGAVFNTPQWGLRLAEKHRGDRVRQLVIAGALVAAEIDRLQRVKNRARSTV